MVFYKNYEEFKSQMSKADNQISRLPKGKRNTLIKQANARAEIGKFSYKDIKEDIPNNDSVKHILIRGKHKTEYDKTTKNNVPTNIDTLSAVKVSGIRMRTFKENNCCVSCGLEGNYFTETVDRAYNRYKERKKGTLDKTSHFSLFYMGDIYPNPVLFTQDHIEPRSLGGIDHVSNTQTMCEKCNGLKSSYYTKEDNLENTIKYIYAKADYQSRFLSKVNSKGTVLNHLDDLPQLKKLLRKNNKDLLKGIDYNYLKTLPKNEISKEDKDIVRKINKGVDYLKTLSEKNGNISAVGSSKSVENISGKDEYNFRKKLVNNTFNEKSFYLNNFQYLVGMSKLHKKLDSVYSSSKMVKSSYYGNNRKIYCGTIKLEDVYRGVQVEGMNSFVLLDNLLVPYSSNMTNRKKKELKEQMESVHTIRVKKQEIEDNRNKHQYKCKKCGKKAKFYTEEFSLYNTRGKGQSSLTLVESVSKNGGQINTMSIEDGELMCQKCIKSKPKKRK